MRLTLLVLLALSVPPLYEVMVSLRPPERGDPAQSLVDNLLAQRGQKTAAGPSVIPEPRLQKLREARDAAARRALEPTGNTHFNRCDNDHVKALRRAATDYAYDKAKEIGAIVEEHGVDQARRAEAIWMNPLSVSAEGAIRKGIAQALIEPDDFGRIGGIEGRRMARGITPTPLVCS